MSPKTVEDAILTALRAAATGAYYTERYEGRAGSVDEIAEWIARVQCPAIAVFYGGASGQSPDERKQSSRAEARFEVWVIGDRLRDYETTMVAPGGIYEILDAVHATLQGQRLGLAVEPLEWLDEQPIASETISGRVVWAQTWRTEMWR